MSFDRLDRFWGLLLLLLVCSVSLIAVTVDGRKMKIEMREQWDSLRYYYYQQVSGIFDLEELKKTF